MLKHNRFAKSGETKTYGLKSIACVAAFLLLMAGVAVAQILYGALTGNVTDPTGAVLAKAHVEALNIATGVARSVDVDSSGVYYFTELQPGVYTVTVSASGFAKASFENVRVDVNALRRVDVKLKVATATQDRDFLRGPRGSSTWT